MIVTNKYNIRTPAFLEMVKEEQKCIDWLNSRMCIGFKRDLAYEALRRVRDRKEAYEEAVEKNMGRF